MEINLDCPKCQAWMKPKQSDISPEHFLLVCGKCDIGVRLADIVPDWRIHERTVRNTRAGTQ